MHCAFEKSSTDAVKTGPGSSYCASGGMFGSICECKIAEYDKLGNPVPYSTPDGGCCFPNYPQYCASGKCVDYKCVEAPSTTTKATPPVTSTLAPPITTTKATTPVTTAPACVGLGDSCKYNYCCPCKCVRVLSQYYLI